MLSLFFNDTATTEIYTLSLHDALPIFLFFAHWLTLFFAIKASSASIAAIGQSTYGVHLLLLGALFVDHRPRLSDIVAVRPGEHTPEIQSCQYLVFRLLLENNHTLPPPL